MDKTKKLQREEQPHGRRDRDSANDRPQKRRDYVAGANGDQDVDASEADAADEFRPDKDGTGW
jgi:hypothetical protein